MDLHTGLLFCFLAPIAFLGGCVVAGLLFFLLVQALELLDGVIFRYRVNNFTKLFRRNE